MPARTRLSADQRRETILRAATEVFARAGYRAGKVSEVAAGVGVTEPVIFQNFGSKAALFAAVLDRAAARVRASLDETVAGFGSASGLLAHVLGPAAHAPAATVKAAPDAGQHGAVARIDGAVARIEGVGAGHRGAHAGPAGGGELGVGRADAGAGLAGAGHGGTADGAAAYGVLFADAAALAGEPELAVAARDAFRAVAAHLADLVRRAQAEGGVRPDADPEAAAWLLLSVLSARGLRTAAMPAGLEPVVAALALGALTAPGGPAGAATPR